MVKVVTVFIPGSRAFGSMGPRARVAGMSMQAGVAF